MITQERVTVRQPPVLDTRPPPASASPPQVESEWDLGNILLRLFLAGVGFAIASIGFMLMLSVFFVFIGLPMFIFGLAVMQAQEN